MSARPTRIAEEHDAPLIESGSIAPQAMAGETSERPAGGGAGSVADRRPAEIPTVGRRRGEANTAAAVAQRAKAELEAITGLDADHVSAVQQQPDGWHVIVDLVELRRIPAATDVLAAYEAVFGPTGLLLSYRRTRRYFRDQMIEES